jgi:23S rRNA (adenine2503-C2)-methyltransferase
VIPVTDESGLETLRRQLKLDPRVIRRLRATLLRSFAGQAAALGTLPDASRAGIETAVRFHELDRLGTLHSALDGASKLLFGTRDGQRIESVILRIKTGRSSVCVSSQTGCAAGCLFCATGRLKGVRNLAPAEILDQVVQAGELLQAEGRRLRNVVFMGMGEPFHNTENLFAALEQLCSAGGFHLSDRHVLVSTVGIPEGIRELSRRFPRVGLAVSLHSVRQAVRDELMPLTRRWPLAMLRGAIEERNRVWSQPVMVEVLMLDGITDTPADCAALQEWLAGLQVHVNLIPYNPVPSPGAEPMLAGRVLRGSGERRVGEFLAELKKAGFKATRRHSLGTDIQAACGQLAQRTATPGLNAPPQRHGDTEKKAECCGN